MEKLSEVEAAGQFVISMVKPIQKEWSGIAAELTQMLQLNQPISTDRYAAFKFALAVIALEIQALPNLLPATQAGRIREHVLGCISSPDLGSYPREAIDELVLFIFPIDSELRVSLNLPYGSRRNNAVMLQAAFADITS